jgi:hypothetical protein
MLDAGASSENHRLFDFFQLYAIIEIAKRFFSKLASGTIRIDVPASRYEPPPNALGIERFARTIGQRHEQLCLRFAFDGSITAQRAGLAAFFPINNVAPHYAMMPGFHQFIFRQILDEFDFECVTFHGTADGGIDDYVCDADDVGLGSIGKRLCGLYPGIGFEGAFEGEENAGFVKRNDAAIAFANGELLTLEWIELHQLELAVEL